MSRRQIDDWHFERDETASKWLPAVPAEADAEPLPAVPAETGTDAIDALDDRDERQLITDAETVDAIAADLPAELVTKWQSDPAGLEYRLAEAQSAVLAITAYAGDADELIASFDALGDAEKTAILHELSMDPSGAARSVSAERLAEIAETQEGYELTEFWGHKAAKKWGVIEQRFGWIRDGLADNGAAIMEWFDSLPFRVRIAVLCVLAG